MTLSPCLRLVFVFLCCLSVNGVPARADDGAEQAQERDSGEAISYIVTVNRGDGTIGFFGGIAPTGNVEQSKWFQLDQKARRLMNDEDLSQSEAVFKEAIQQAEAKGQYEPGVINSLCGLSFLYHKKGNFAESDRVYEYAMRNLEGVSGGRETSRFSDYLPDLAWLYNEHGKADKAEALLKHAVSVRERSDGAYSKTLKKALADYASFLKKVGRDTEARHLQARIKSIADRDQL